MNKGLNCILGGIIGTVLALSLPGSARADIYRYVDAQGVVHFTDTPTIPRFNLYLKEGGGGRSLKGIIRHYAGVYHLEEALVRAVIKAESDFDPKAVSAKGAVGMMQLMPDTAREMAVRHPKNAEENIRGGSCYLRKMLDLFHGDLPLALAAYNAGPSVVQRCGGIPPYGETRSYVKRVQKYLKYYRRREDKPL